MNFDFSDLAHADRGNSSESSISLDCAFRRTQILEPRQAVRPCAFLSNRALYILSEVIFFLFIKSDFLKRECHDNQ